MWCQMVNLYRKQCVTTNDALGAGCQGLGASCSYSLRFSCVEPLLPPTSVSASQPCTPFAVPEGVPFAAVARWRAVSGEDLGPHTLKPAGQRWHACGAPTHAGPLFRDGETWLSAPFMPGQLPTVPVFPAVTLRIPVPTPAEPRGQVWLTLSPEPPAPPAYRYPAAWHKVGVEARLPQGL